MKWVLNLVLGATLVATLATSADATSLPVVSSGELLIQLDANELTTLTLDGSNRVSEWDDQAATDSFSLGGSFTNADLVQQPVWVPNAINGIAPAVRFDGTGTSTNWLRATSGNTSTLALTLFWVVQGAPGVTNPRGLLDTGPAQASVVRFYPDNVIAVQREPQNQAKAPVTLPLDQPIVLTVSLTNGVSMSGTNLHWQVFFNGVSQTNFTEVTDRTHQRWVGPVLGGINLGSAGRFSGDIGAFVAYNGVLEATERQAVMESLLSAYSVPEPTTVSLLAVNALIFLRRKR